MSGAGCLTEAIGMAPGAARPYEETMDAFKSDWIDFGAPGADPVAGTVTLVQVFEQARKA